MSVEILQLAGDDIAVIQDDNSVYAAGTGAQIVVPETSAIAMPYAPGSAVVGVWREETIAGDASFDAVFQVLYSQYETAIGRIDNEQIVRSNAIAAETSARQQLSSSFSTALTSEASTRNAQIVAEQNARTSADEALANSIQSLSSSVSGNSAAITQESTTRATADSALSSRIDNLVVASGSGFSAAIDAEATARIAGDTALASQITSLTSTVNANNTAQTAAINSESTARANADSALAVSQSTLSVSINSRINAKRTWRQASEPLFSDMFPPGVNSFAEANLDKDNLFPSIFGAATTSSLTVSSGRDFAPEWTLSGGHTIYIHCSGTMQDKSAAYQSLWTWTLASVDIVPGKTYEFSAYTGAHRCRAVAIVDFYSATDTYISSIASTEVNDNDKWGGVNLSDYKRLKIFATAPANAKKAYFVIVGDNLGSVTQPVNPWVYVTRPYFGELPESQKASPLSASTPTDWQPFEPPVWYDTDDNNKLYIWQGHSLRFVASDDSRITSNAAAISNEAVARANADGALASQISSISTTVGNNSASITNLQGSYNGLSVKYGIVGTINGQTGGFVFTGVGKNDGSAIYNLEIGANVTINGSLIVNGTIKNQGLEDYAASNSGMSIGVKNSGNVSVRVRKNARVACIVSYSPPAAWDNFSPTTLKISANGQTFYSVPVLNFFDYINLPVTITAIYPGNIGTRIQGNGQASASAEYSYTEQYVAYYVWAGFPVPVYASRTVSFPAAYAFDDSQSSTWLAPKSGSPWIKYIFAQSIQAGAYKVMGFSSLASGSTQGRAPKAWSLQASNDGTNWTTLDTRSNQTGWGDQEDRQFQISGTNGVYNNYTQYRMVITESVDANETLVGVVQLSFFLPGDVSDSQNVVFNAFIDSSSNFLGNVSIYVVELSK